MASINKFIVAIAAIVAVMSALVLLPGINNQSSNLQGSGNSQSPSSQLLSIDYSRQNFTAVGPNDTEPAGSVQLSVTSDGAAKYSRSGTNTSGSGNSKDFALSQEEVSQLNALIMDTGFMQIPSANYPQSNDTSGFTRYTLTVHTSTDGFSSGNALPGSSGASTKSMTWVDLSSSKTSVPPIIRTIGTQLDQIISNHQ